jgi:hypothetical protein
LTWLKILLCNFFLENTVDCCDIFPHSLSILFLYFLKLYFLIFFNMELIENFGFVIFLKHFLLLQYFFAWFFLWFSLKLSFFILFFNIELVKNYSYNMWGKHFNFPQKLLLVATIFFPTWFFSVFVMFFSKIIFVNFIF